MKAQKFARLTSLCAIILSVAGLICVGYIFFNRDPDETLFKYVWGLISWVLLLWGNIMSFRTCRKYNLEVEDARFFSYISFGVLGLFIGNILAQTTAVVISFLFVVLIVKRKKKIAEQFL